MWEAYQIHFQSEYIEMWTFRLEVSKREDNSPDGNGDYEGDDNPAPWPSSGPWSSLSWKPIPHEESHAFFESPVQS